MVGLMPIKWELVEDVNKLEDYVLERIKICDTCSSCDKEVGRCLASSCQCFAISLAHQKDFDCPLNKWKKEESVSIINLEGI
jgi:hypothetical protein